jgi:Fur family transcriptional regulator, ferric uptake regulator
MSNQANMKYIIKDPSALCRLSVPYKNGKLQSYFDVTMKEEGIEILKRNHLSVTNIRKDILQLLLQKKTGLSHRDFEKGLSADADRTTIYRTLQTFSEKGIIHTIPTTNDTIQYALCKETCGEDHHTDNHAHFACERCGTTYCLDSVVIPNIKAPKGFTIKQKDLVMTGICKSCDK